MTQETKPALADTRSAGRVQAANMSPASRADFSDTSSHASRAVDSETIHAVSVGDTLPRLAGHYYGDTSAWPRIFDANRDRLTDPARLQPGQMLKIPARP